MKEKRGKGHTAVQSEWTSPSRIYPVYQEWSIGTGKGCLEDCASYPGSHDEYEDDTGISAQVPDTNQANDRERGVCRMSNSSGEKVKSKASRGS